MKRWLALALRMCMSQAVLASALHADKTCGAVDWHSARSIRSQYPEMRSGRTPALRLWPGLVFCCWLWSVPAVAVSSTQAPFSSAAGRVAEALPVPQGPGPSPQMTPDAEEEEEIEELEEEVGDRDPTYLRTRAIVRYDHRLFEGVASSDRIRLRFLYAFGPLQRFAVSVLEPLIQTNTPGVKARGSGDAELQFNANVLHRERFRAGIGVHTTLQTASDARLGGTTTTLKPSVEAAAVLASRLEVVGAAYYKQSIDTPRGIPAKQFEPDIIVNGRAFDATWFVEWDSFYDILPGRFAQTLKPGVSRAFGQGRRWVATAYCGIGVNDYARQSQYRYDVGVDMMWYPRKHR